MVGRSATAAADELCARSATELASAIRRSEVSPVEVVDAVLARIDKVNPRLNAFCTVTAEQARRRAQLAADEVARGAALGPLHGVPYSLKDLTDTAGVRTTLGSALFRDRVPQADAVLAERMARAGGILVGKTNTPDHGCKGVTDNPVFGQTKNPWDLTRTPGGSSGGASAAVAAGMAPLAEGSDFAGSIRIPASFCGLVGYKPSVGRVPIYPNDFLWHPVSFISGPITRTVADAALMLQVIAGADERDPVSLPDPTDDYLDATREEATPRSAKIAWSPDLGFAMVDPEVVEVCHAAVRSAAEAIGASVTEYDLGLPDSTDAYQLLNATLRAGLMEDYFPGRRDEMDPLMAWRTEHARERRASHVAVAERTQSIVYERLRTMFQTYDYLVLPTTPTTAFDIELTYQREIGGSPVDSPFQTLPLTFVFNLSGHPAVSIPAGWSADGMPVGLQIVGRWRDDASVLALAAAFERVLPWRHRWPDLAST
ncbi:MAG TPA: amidase [Actinomycetes bacterium]|nr:amidase [Actinomycetes bacterium]